MLIFSERQLWRVLAEYEMHYNTHRPHRALEQQPPSAGIARSSTSPDRPVRRTEKLGGLINEYRQAA
jgi:putative transposase